MSASRHHVWASAKFWRDSGGTLWHSLRGYPHTRDLSMGVTTDRNARKIIEWLDSFSIPVEGRAAIAKAEGGSNA